jgi:hypothetical protein
MGLRTPRVQPMYRDRHGETAEWVRSQFEHSKAAIPVPVAWLPHLCRVCVGASQVGLALSIFLHSFQSDSGFTPVMITDDFARETGFTKEQMRTAIKNALQRGLIECSPESPWQYRLCPEKWAEAENAFAMRNVSLESLGEVLDCPELDDIPAEVSINGERVEMERLKPAQVQALADKWDKRVAPVNLKLAEVDTLLEWMKPYGPDITVREAVLKRMAND